MPEQRTDAARIAELERKADQLAAQIEAMHMICAALALGLDSANGKGTATQILLNNARRPSLGQTEVMTKAAESVIAKMQGIMS